MGKTCSCPTPAQPSTKLVRNLLELKGCVQRTRIYTCSQLYAWIAEWEGVDILLPPTTILLQLKTNCSCPTINQTARYFQELNAVRRTRISICSQCYAWIAEREGVDVLLSILFQLKQKYSIKRIGTNPSGTERCSTENQNTYLQATLYMCWIRRCCCLLSLTKILLQLRKLFLPNHQIIRSKPLRTWRCTVSVKRTGICNFFIAPIGQLCLFVTSRIAQFDH